ncbi:ABC transporter ATP-binding protein [Leptobacterium sp. I13]|uniref:ABC transporter ATP-binding protein n=1 Tax=Leptobacterium meishanense TaxID=3128904 RepID=UPI0030EEFB3F
MANTINFSLQLGELVAIVGANGVGKSTLLRTLAAVQPKLSGKIQLNDKELQAHTPTSLAKELSIVLTEPISSKNLTVNEVVALGRHPYTNWIGTLTENDRIKIRKTLMLTNMLELQYKRCYELSDGQLQKAMITRALAQDTPLMILDEPTTHLDIYHKAYILKLLKKIAHETQRAVLFSSHEIEMAIQLCDKILVMTPTGSIFGQPFELIEQNTFSNLFPKDLIDFDAASGTFKINK